MRSRRALCTTLAAVAAVAAVTVCAGASAAAAPGASTGLDRVALTAAQTDGNG